MAAKENKGVAARSGRVRPLPGARTPATAPAKTSSVPGQVARLGTSRSLSRRLPSVPLARRAEAQEAEPTRDPRTTYRIPGDPGCQPRVSRQAWAGVFPPDREAVFKRRSAEHTSELQSLMRISYAGFC